MDISSAFIGVTIPLDQLLHEIHIRNWQVTNVGVSNHEIVAKAKNPQGETIERTGPDEQTAVAALLTYIIRLETVRATHKLAEWNTAFTGQMQEIAQAYAKAPIFEPKAATAWKELADDSVARARVLMDQIEVEPVNDPAPYESLEEMCEDIKKKKHLFISLYNLQHPVWTRDQYVAFRVAHNVLGHCAANGDWSWEGENLATGAHMALLSPTAQQALFSETLGQSAYAAFYQAPGPQKVSLLKDYMEDAQEAENASGHTGVLPQFMMAPGEVPAISNGNGGNPDGDN